MCEAIMTINFYLEKRAKIEGEKVRGIVCFVREKGKTYSFNTGYKCRLDQWQANAQLAKRNSSENTLEQLNERLNNLRKLIEEVERSVRSVNSFAPIELVFAEIKRRRSNTTGDFFGSLDEYIAHLRTKGSISTSKKFSSLKNHLNNVDRKFRNMNFSSLISNPGDWFEVIQKYFMPTHEKSTILKNIQFVQMFLRWCVRKQKIEGLTLDKIKDIELWEAPEKRFVVLSPAEINKIASFKVEGRLKKIRDLFVFQYLTSQRFSDIINFNRADVDDNYIWILRQQKTKKDGRLRQIALHDCAIEILEEYNWRLPKISNVKFNKYIKELMQLVGIEGTQNVEAVFFGKFEKVEKPRWQLVSSHTARRSAITHGFQLGIDRQLVKSQAGHSSMRQTEDYYQYDPKLARETVNNIIKISRVG